MSGAEEWRPIPGLTHYEASSLGNIRMLTHKETMRARGGGMMTRTRQGKVLRQCLAAGKYHDRFAVSIKNRLHPV